MRYDKVILAVSFGTSCAYSREHAIAPVENALACAFPAYQVERAFTSGMILRKLREEHGLEIENVAQALERFAAQGVREVFCQPTHIIPGDEYEKMIRDAVPFNKYFDSLRFGCPLLYSVSDFSEVVSAVTPRVSTDTALVWMGHGSGHFADCAYAALAYHYHVQGLSHVFVGTVEGYPALDDILPLLKASGLRKVLLAPFMLVAGDHAQNDMAGESPDSWIRRLTEAGFQVECHMRGLGEEQVVQRLIVRHAAQILCEQGRKIKNT